MNVLLPLAALSASILAATPAVAADVQVRVVDAAGQPVEDAVVTIHPAAGVATGPIRFPWPMRMTQQDVAFVPHVLIVPVGASVDFPNRDKVRHHVYSFSKPARFEIKLFGRDETHRYTFRTAGAVALGCNIHDRMSGFIKVVDTPFAGRTDAGGATLLNDVTAGATRVTVWHPRLRAKDNEAVFALDVPAGAPIAKRIQIALR